MKLEGCNSILPIEMLVGKGSIVAYYVSRTIE